MDEFELIRRFFSRPSDSPAVVAGVGDDGYGMGMCVGDIDGDGFLDLVCGNFDQSNLLYLFQPQEQEFTAEPSWQSRPDWHEYNTRCIALGDVDSDGYLDLVCGNDGEPNTLYLGSPVTYFTQDPTWSSSDSSPTHSILLTDVDGDGDLDLLCGNHGAPTTLYRNENNRLTENPVWFSDESAPTTCLAGGDIDRDGDLDVLSASQNDNKIAWYENTAGDGSAWATNVISTAATPAIRPEIP